MMEDFLSKSLTSLPLLERKDHCSLSSVDRRDTTIVESSLIKTMVTTFTNKQKTCSLDKLFSYLILPLVILIYKLISVRS